MFAQHGRKLKPTIKATSNPRVQRDEPDSVHDPRDNSNTTNKQSTSSHHLFTAPIHSTYSHHLFTAPIHSIYSQHVFTAPVHSICSQHIFTVPIHTTHSHWMLALAQPTATSSRSAARRHSSAARRRTQPEKCGRKLPRACVRRTNGPTEVHRVSGERNTGRGA